MSITEEFRNAIAKNDKKLVRIMIKDSIVVDSTLVEFNEMIKVAESGIRKPRVFQETSSSVVSERQRQKR